MKTNKIKLLLSCGALVVLGAASLQGCSSSDDSSSSTGGTGGTSAGGTGGKTGTGGTGTAGKTGTAGSGTAGSSTAGTSSTAGSSAGGTSAAAGATGSEAGEPGAAGAGPVTQADLCDKFCADEMVACTGPLLQYTTVGECTTACNQFTLGSPDDTGGQNTLYCRIYHLSVAAMSSALATMHCAHTKATPAAGTPCATP